MTYSCHSSQLPPSDLPASFVQYSFHRRSQDFVWGALFLTKKADDLFLVVALKEHLNTPPNLTRPAKTVLKIDSYSGWGCNSCPMEVHLHIFPCKLLLKNFFHRPGVQVHPLHHLAMPMILSKFTQFISFCHKSRVWQTDRKTGTDGETNGRTALRSPIPRCIKKLAHDVKLGWELK